MLLTLSEATRLDCPVKIYTVNEEYASYHNFAITAQQSCSGDNCPAWRWESKCELACCVCEDADPDPEITACHRKGYCGLGGPVTEKVKF